MKPRRLENRPAPDSEAPASLDPDGLPPGVSRVGSGCRLSVTVVPQARHTGLDGIYGDSLRIRLGAPPVDGKANEALLDWLSQALNLPRRAIRLTHGMSSRRKRLDIDLDAVTVARRLGVSMT